MVTKARVQALSQILAVSLNPRSSALSLRDRLSLDDGDVSGFLSRLRGHGVAQALLINTCDRFDVYACDAEPPRAIERIIDLIALHANVSAATVREHAELLIGRDAVRHVFRVGASLDSMMVGEPHILGQMRAALKHAQACGMVLPDLYGLMRSALTSARRVRSETQLSQRPLSMTTAAVELVSGVHGDLSACSALLIGDGDTGNAIARGLIAAGLDTLLVTDPRSSRASRLACTLDCHTLPFEDLGAMLSRFDVVVSALGGRSFIIHEAMVAAALKARRNAPLVLIDAAIPGDVDPRVERRERAFLYRLEDLESAVGQNEGQWAVTLSAAHQIVECGITQFIDGYSERTAIPAVRALRDHFESVRQQALADAGEDAEKATWLLINRLLHTPTMVLKDAARLSADDEEHLPRLYEALDRLFARRTDADDETP